MPVRIWTKPETQGFIKRLRRNGYVVNKGPTGIYRADDAQGQVFTALPGARGYMVNIAQRLIQTEEGPTLDE